MADPTRPLQLRDVVSVNSNVAVRFNWSLHSPFWLPRDSTSDRESNPDLPVNRQSSLTGAYPPAMLMVPVLAVLYLSVSLEGALMLQMARDWPRLVSGWGKVDRAMKDRYGYPPRMRRSVVTLTAVMSGYMLVKMFLPTTAVFQEPWSNYRDERDVTFVDPTSSFYMGCSLLRGVTLYLVVKMMELMIIYQDLLVMVVSKCLYVRFKQVNDKLRRHRRQNHPPLFWRRLREDFSRLYELTQRVDSVFNKIILLSYFLNVFSICISCFNTLR
ncbi:unnamed protein product [Timema podura]|uniref:Uncharacterized protein n=1 Tax=Timema podura TaxID=61482 RepID=A0ABN7NZG0_TIMPD|nr:unnamed protein product [Timema podura]